MLLHYRTMFNFSMGRNLEIFPLALFFTELNHHPKAHTKSGLYLLHSQTLNFFFSFRNCSNFYNITLDMLFIFISGDKRNCYATLSYPFACDKSISRLIIWTKSSGEKWRDVRKEMRSTTLKFHWISPNSVRPCHHLHLLTSRDSFKSLIILH